MAGADDQQDALATTAKGSAVTFERPVPTDLAFDKPYVPRALKAVDAEHPYGTADYPNKNLTVLQQHVDFFDTNHDGVIEPWETCTGFRRLGFNILVSAWAASVIHGGMSYATVPGWLPSWTFAIYTENIHKAKHGSDSAVYDTEGRFVPSKFEEIFTKFAKTYPDRMNFSELNAMTQALRLAWDVFGWLANKFEWGFLYWIAKDEAGFVSKDAIRGAYDGSYFVHVAEQVEAKKSQHKKKKTT